MKKTNSDKGCSVKNKNLKVGAVESGIKIAEA